MKRLSAIVLTVLLALPLFAAPVTAAQTCNHKVYMYETPNAVGPGVAYCAEDYPLARTPVTAADFDSETFNDGSIVNNRISSIRFDPTVGTGYKVKLYTGYSFSGSSVTYTKPAGSNPVFNLGTGFSNAISGFAGCGTVCETPGG